MANKSQENITKETRSCFRNLSEVTGNKNPSQTFQQKLRFGFDKTISGFIETLRTWAKVRHNTKKTPSKYSCLALCLFIKIQSSFSPNFLIIS